MMVKGLGFMRMKRRRYWRVEALAEKMIFGLNLSLEVDFHNKPGYYYFIIKLDGLSNSPPLFILSWPVQLDGPIFE